MVQRGKAIDRLAYDRLVDDAFRLLKNKLRPPSTSAEVNQKIEIALLGGMQTSAAILIESLPFAKDNPFIISVCNGSIKGIVANLSAFATEEK